MLAVLSHYPWLIAALVGLLIIGLLIGWLLTAASARRAQQLLTLQHRHEIDSLQIKVDHLSEKNAELENQRQALLDKYEAAHQRINQYRQTISALNAQREAEQSNHQQQLEKIEAAETRLSDTFKRLAGEIFEQKQKTFTENSKQQITTLINPLNNQISDFAKLVREVSAQGNKQHGELQQKLLDLQSLNQNLSQEASQLVEALRGSNKIIGNWGELQLEKILQMAGLRNGHEYQLQVSVTGKNNNRQLLDALVLLPDNKNIVIDSKVSLEHYTRACHAETATDQAHWMKQHCDSLRTHIKGLSVKDYSAAAELNTPDFVLMFVPVEAALQEALITEPDLMDIAVRQNIVLCGPTTLLSALRTVGSVWQAWRQNENAREIGERAGRLYDKFVGFIDNLNLIGTRLGQTQNAYDDALKQLSSGRGNLLVQTEKLRELGAKTTKRLDIGNGETEGMLEDKQQEK